MKMLTIQESSAKYKHNFHMISIATEDALMLTSVLSCINQIIIINLILY